MPAKKLPPKIKAELPFDAILAKGLRAGQVPARTVEARAWFRAKASGVRGVKSDSLIEAVKKDRTKTKAEVGSMYFFRYDPKWKEELPFYDTFPCVIAIEYYKDGFLGLNLHYLPLQLRAKLMDALYGVANNKTYDYSTKLKVSYQMLKAAAKYRLFRPCVKRYLYSHVESKFIKIYATEWDIAMFLPVASWKKATESQVHAASRKMLK